MRSVVQRVWIFGPHTANELRYAATASIWFRWVIMAVCLVEVSYRVDYGALSHVLNTLYLIAMMAANWYVWRRLRSSGRVEPGWLLALSAMDAAGVSFSTWLSGGFDSRYFGMYYCVIAMFAWVFTSPYLVFAGTTVAVGLYVGICLVAGDGIDLGLMEEKELFYRILGMYGMAVSVNLITRYERVRRLGAVQREREMSRQRIEMSENIHDTTAQYAYMMGLGVEGVIAIADKSDTGLIERLEGMSELSRSTMWTLRHPIDGGQIFSGDTLGQVLSAHADTFTVITSIPAVLVQRGDEPELSTITRSLLFSIAHNALTNAFRHSGARSVTLVLNFGEDELCLSVSDDGVGLPEDYAGRGHGFRNMRADAARLGGELHVESDGHGTTVSCVVPYDHDQGGR